MSLWEHSMNTNQLWFLNSTRFLALLIGCISIMIGSDGVATWPEIFLALKALSAGFITLKTAHDYQPTNNLNLTANKTPEIQ